MRRTTVSIPEESEVAGSTIIALTELLQLDHETQFSCLWDDEDNDLVDIFSAAALRDAVLVCHRNKIPLRLRIEVDEEEGAPAAAHAQLLTSSDPQQQNLDLKAPEPSTDAHTCLLYTSDAADDLLCVDLGGRRIIKKKTNIHDT
eukprot:TRINITY_DN3506_c0_g1_i2.p1 TRINITY_DN3506_c0_g1~~TRINITY_DN3506_c0_g1_i2.p1  ORF type:complete len:145 (+),score=52.30 TRINITY_DN3506_c0_g1_i2:169-603(+)